MCQSFTTYIAPTQRSHASIDRKKKAHLTASFFGQQPVTVESQDAAPPHFSYFTQPESVSPNMHDTWTFSAKSCIACEISLPCLPFLHSTGTLKFTLTIAWA